MKKFIEIVSNNKVSGFEASARNDIANKKQLDEEFESALLTYKKVITPQEKAIELVDRFFWTTVQTKPQAKLCALICVDEMENALTNYGKLTGELQNMDSEFRYLEELKTEIEKL